MKDTKSYRKKSIIIVIIASILILIPILGFVIWFNLPVTVQRNSDIKFAEEIIKNIDSYRQKKELPSDTAYQTLRQFGFKEGDFGFLPEYSKINDNTYELIYVEGFDGPYLMWNSRERKWKVDFPSIPDIYYIDEVVKLIEEQKIVMKEAQLVDSLSNGRRHISIIPTLNDTSKNIYLVQVGEDNGMNLVVYFNFLVDANKMTIINPTGKLCGQ